MPVRVSLASLFLLALSAIAFWPPYLSKPQSANAYLHAHAFLGVAWLVLLVVQPLLVEASRLAVHRLVGRVGAALGGAFAFSGVLVAHRSLARMGESQFTQEGRFVYLPLVMAVIFAVALAMALLCRAAPAVHSRFMAATVLPLLDPILARLLYFYAPPLPAEYLYQVPAFVIIGAALAVLARSLPASVYGRAAFVWFSIGTAVALLGFFVVPNTEAWLSFVTWFRALPIT